MKANAARRAVAIGTLAAAVGGIVFMSRMAPPTGAVPATSMTGPDTMRIHFERTGGVAGMRLAITIAADTLVAEQAQQLRDLIDAAQFFELPAEITAPAPRPDEFQYRVTVETDGREHTVVTTDSAAPESLRPLLDWLSRTARQARRPR